MQLRDGQTGALRRGYLATRFGEELQARGFRTSFNTATGVLDVTDQMDRTSRLQLSAAGAPDGFTTPMGRHSRLRFNSDLLVTELIDPSGRQTTLEYDQNRAPLRFARDGTDLARLSWNQDYSRNVVEFWDGTRASSYISAAGKPLRLTDRTGASETFDYDARNRLRRMVDGRGNAVRFTYDDEGRPSTTHYADGRTETVQYDGAGRWVGTLLNGRQIFRRQADPEHRPLSARYADGRKDAFSYDDAGRLTGAEGPDGALAFGYDEHGRPNIESNGKEAFKLEYDKSGLLTAIEYPGGLRAEYGYDADKRLASVAWGGASFAFAYDRVDKEFSTSFSNHLTSRTELALSGKPARVTTADRRSGSICFDTEYRYDLQERLSARNDSGFGIRQYVYDGESQLLGVADGRNNWHETFAYDGAGNRIATSGQAVHVDAGNRLLSQGDVTCRYDRRGNVVLIADRAGTWRFKYDLKNQMTEARGPSGLITFKYDTLGRRIEKQSRDRTIRFVWCGEGLAREVITTAQGESVREYLYQPGRYEPLALRIDGRSYFYHNDHQGTPQRITDDQGRVVWQADHFAFGYANLKVELIENPLRFAGQYADSETGLHYNRFRYYSPVLGRYLSVDPLRLLAGNNLYLYVRNNPLNKLDGLGLWSVLGVVGAVVAAAAVVVVAPFLLAAAPLIVAGGLLVAEAISVGKDFCLDCFIHGFGEAFIPGLIMGAGAALVLGAIAVVCAPAAAIIGVAAGCYFAYQMLDQHFGWSGGKPFDQMTPKEKSESMGRLAGGTVGAVVGGLGMGELVSFAPEGGVPIEDSPAGELIDDPPPGDTSDEPGAFENPVGEDEPEPTEDEPEPTEDEPEPTEDEPEPTEDEPEPIDRPAKDSPEDIDQRVQALKDNPNVTSDPAPDGDGGSVLDETANKAKAGDPGSIGELESIERHATQGDTVRVRSESTEPGVTSPDLDVNGKQTEVKTRTEPVGNRGISDLVTKANQQVKNSGDPGPGQAEINLKGDAAESAPSDSEIDRQVRSKFNEGRSRSLDRVDVLKDGKRIGTWERDPTTGKVTKIFPPPDEP